jgi:hypothetical protein
MIGRPFEPGNKMGKGRPPGSKNKAAVFQAQLAGNGIEIINQAKYQALKKDPNSIILKACLERLVPVPKALSRFRLPPIRTPDDLPKANAAILQAVARGRLSPSDGETVSRILMNQRQLFDDDADRRLRIVEQRKDTPDAA